MTELSEIQYMRALSLIYSHRVSGFYETLIGFDPKQKGNLNLQRIAKTRLSVDRAVDRPLSTVDCPVDQTQQRADCFQSVDRAVDHSLATVHWAVDRPFAVHVVHIGRPSGRPTLSTGGPCGRPGPVLVCCNAPFVPFVFRSLCYLPLSPLFVLSPYRDFTLLS